ELLTQPNASLLGSSLKNEALVPYLHPLLPRYRNRTLEDAVSELLKTGRGEEAANALLSAVFLEDAAHGFRNAVSTLLTNESDRLRDLAGEYFRWHGTTGDLDALRDAEKKEEDVYVRASLSEAVLAIEARSAWGKGSPERGGAVPLREDGSADFREMRHRFSQKPTWATADSFRNWLRESIPVAPYHGYHKDGGIANEHLKPRTAARSLGRLLTVLAGYSVEPPVIGSAEKLHPVAASVMPPVTDYLDPKRKSFGLFIDPDKYPEGRFLGQFHVGDDVAWKRPGITVVAIADGIVRVADPGVPSWGGLVVIEHQGKDGSRFCSQYGHLGLVIGLAPGTRVKKGRKLGVLGRPWTLDNGGYDTHLHFGLFRGPFSARATVGYLRPEAFNGKSRGWVDPQGFFRRFPNSDTGSSGKVD
ncbi:MAG: M23 family metallopeptidase, partial [Verrucomicrobiota bacterium]